MSEVSLHLFQIGDHIERIDGVSLVGKRHFEVAKMLKEIPKGTTFVMRLVQPLKAGFCEFSKSPTTKKKKYMYIYIYIYIYIK